jgi:cytochrome c
MMKRHLRLVGAVLTLGLPALMPAHGQEGDATRGRSLFQRQCQSCHQLAQPRNGAGPHLRNLIGRTVGGETGFNYSPALRALGGTWTPQTLDAYLANPSGVARGTRMTLRVGAEQDRRDIIAYLAGP